MHSSLELNFCTPETPRIHSQYNPMMKGYLNPDIDEVPFPHQEEMFRRATIRKKFALFAEQRTGKTMVAIAYMDWATKIKNVKRILIVCPLTVIGTWVQQIIHYDSCDFRVYATNSKVKANLKQLIWGDCEQQIVVVNYEATWRRIEEFMHFNPELVIMDESHKIKNGQSNQHKACLAIAKRAEYRLLMTGTPIAGNPVDAFYQYKVMDSTIFGSSKSKFIDFYCNMDPRFPRKFLTYKNLAAFTEVLNSASYRVKLKDVVKDMPKDLVSFYEVEFSKEESDMYNQMKEEAVLELESGVVTAPIALTKLLRLHEFCGGYLPLHGEDIWDNNLKAVVKGSVTYSQVSCAKKHLLREILEELFEKDPTRKVVIFHRYKPEVNGISDVLSKMDLGFVSLMSKQDANERHALITKFQEDPDIRAIVTPISIGGVGIKLNAADTTIFYSTDFSSINYEQAKARVHDLSSNTPVLHIHLIVKGTVDKYIYKMLEKKLSVSGMPFKEIYNIIKGANINDKQIRDEIIQEDKGLSIS